MPSYANRPKIHLLGGSLEESLTAPRVQFLETVGPLQRDGQPLASVFTGLSSRVQGYVQWREQGAGFPTPQLYGLGSHVTFSSSLCAQGMTMLFLQRGNISNPASAVSASSYIILTLSLLSQAGPMVSLKAAFKGSGENLLSRVLDRSPDLPLTVHCVTLDKFLPSGTQHPHLTVG